VGTASEHEPMGKVLFIDVESGDLTLHRWPEMHVVGIDKYSDINTIYAWLKHHVQHRDIYLFSEQPEAKAKAREILVQLQQKLFPTYDGKEEPFLYRTVILDSLSELQRYSMYQLTGTIIGMASLAVEPGKAGWDEWGKSTDMIRLLIRSFRDLNIHTIMVCSETMSANAEKKKSPITVNLPKKLAEDVPGFFDIVGYLAANVHAQTGTTERRLYLNPGQNFMAKNRFGFDKQFIESPTMAKVMALVK
jgi:hypothetical protein